MVQRVLAVLFVVVVKHIRLIHLQVNLFAGLLLQSFDADVIEQRAL